MIDQEIIDDAIMGSIINNRVVGLSPAVSLGSNMLALAASMARDYSNATNQQQLNYMAAMAATVQSIGVGRPSCDSRTVDEAMGLLKQVLAAVQAN